MDEKFKKEEIKKEKKEKKYLITNRNNRPIEIRIETTYYRLEPRGKEKDSIIIGQDIINHSDLQSQLDEIIIREEK
jgi:hypothetical protein